MSKPKSTSISWRRTGNYRVWRKGKVELLEEKGNGKLTRYTKVEIKLIRDHKEELQVNLVAGI